MSLNNFSRDEEFEKFYGDVLINIIPDITDGVIKENLKFLDILNEYNYVGGNIFGLKKFLEEEKGYKVRGIKYVQLHSTHISASVSEEEKAKIMQSKYLIGLKQFCDDYSQLEELWKKLERGEKAQGLDSYFIIVENKSLIPPDITETVKAFLISIFSNPSQHKS